MIFEIVQFSCYGRCVSIADDFVFELIVSAIRIALVTEAGEEHVQDEEGNSDSDENHVLKEVDKQDRFNLVLMLGNLTDFVFFFPIVDSSIREEDGGSKDHNLDAPFRHCGP